MKSYILLIFLGIVLILSTGCENQDNIGPETGTITDYEGNVYPTVKIGHQWWMAKNLKSTKYNNGDQISTTEPVDLSITGESSPKYQWAYLGNEGLAAIYGRLYTWYAVTDERSVCPTGWHVPSNTEWNTLTDYLIANGHGYMGDGNDIAKSMAATSGWLIHGLIGVPGNDQASNNSSGFSVMPAGVRESNGDFLYAGADGFYWSSTAVDENLSWLRLVDFDVTIVPPVTLNKKVGLSVRCVRD